MTQPKRSKNEMAEIVKLIHEAVPGDFVKVLEHSIQSIMGSQLFFQIVSEFLQIGC